jgi:hypothetical protein
MKKILMATAALIALSGTAMARAKIKYYPLDRQVGVYMQLIDVAINAYFNLGIKHRSVKICTDDGQNCTSAVPESGTDGFGTITQTRDDEHWTCLISPYQDAILCNRHENVIAPEDNIFTYAKKNGVWFATIEYFPNHPHMSFEDQWKNQHGVGD